MASVQGSRRRRYRLLAASVIALLLLAALLLPPLVNLSRYQRQIQGSLAASLGHPVEVSGITLTLLPRPGVQIANFVVDSTAGYSAEPILQCSSVTAAFRLTSLWRGRLEIARISLDEPSLNLERAPNGQWNFASVLLQASRTPQAPTGRTLPHGQHRFPYIEVSNGRINFKHGAEKLPFSFMNADVSLWLENSDEWQVRFAAQPMRTDINLSLADTGTVRISGSVHRASVANELPLDLDVAWTGAPLGQATHMLLARDLGWRGNTRVSAHISGIPDALALRMTAETADFHRESFEPAQPMNLHATCTATYRHGQGLLDDLQCLSPEGALRLSGDIGRIHTDDPQYHLALAVTHLPAAAALQFLRLTRDRLSGELKVDGFIDGELTYTQSARYGRPVAAGALLATHLGVRMGDLDQALPDLRFSAAGAAPAALILEPARIDFDATQPLLASGLFTRQGYLIHYSGGAELARLLPLVGAFRVMPAGLKGIQGSGSADYNLTIQGDWLAPAMDLDHAIPLSTMSGSLALHNAVFKPSYLLEPVHIASATATFSPAELRWNGISATLGTTHFAGGFSIPLPCASACLRHFDITAATVSVGPLVSTLKGEDEGVVEDLLNRMRSPQENWPPLDGTLHITYLLAGKTEIQDVAAALELHGNSLRIDSLDGRTLGGTVHATGTVTIGPSPVYRVEVQLRRLSAPALASLLDEQWGPGQIDIDGDLAMNGNGAPSLAGSASGQMRWSWTGGALPSLTSTPFRHFDRWTANGRVAEGQLTLTTSEITSGNTTWTVNGTLRSDRSLNLQIGAPAAAAGNTGQIVTLTGTLDTPALAKVD